MEHDSRLHLACTALEGLSVGDAVGRHPTLTGSGWRYSDDTEMAIAIIEVLKEHQTIEQDALAAGFARRYARDPERGYGAVAYWLLYQLTQGGDWRRLSKEIFRGQGSLGNGAAMRAAPVGAYFADDLREVARQAQLSAAVTHAHPDGQAGALAVAVAAAWISKREPMRTASAMFDAVLDHTPAGPTRDGIITAAALQASDPRAAALVLGDGSEVRSSDTVPLALWCAGRHLHNYEQALRDALTACERPSSDKDTVCAIVGSIVVLSAGVDAIPVNWRNAREPLDL